MLRLRPEGGDAESPLVSRGVLRESSSWGLVPRVYGELNRHQLEPDADEVVYIHWLRRCVEVLCTIKLNRNSSFQSSMTTIFLTQA